MMSSVSMSVSFNAQAISRAWKKVLSEMVSAPMRDSAHQLITQSDALGMTMPTRVPLPMPAAT
jgi:hypothetical protein